MRASPTYTEAYFIALEERRCRAEIESDVAALDELLDDDFVYVHVSGTIDQKATVLASREFMKFPEMSRRNLSVYVGDGVAVITGGLSFRAWRVGNPQVRVVDAYATQVLTHRSDGWKFVLHQATLLQMTSEDVTESDKARSGKTQLRS